MFSSLPYYTVIVHLLYTFNLVNYIELDCCQHSRDWSQGLTMEDDDAGTLNEQIFKNHGLILSKTTSPPTTSSFIQVLFWGLGLYFATSQVYSLFRHHTSTWKRCFILLGTVLAVAVEYGQVSASPSEWKFEKLQPYDLLLGCSLLLNAILLLYFILRPLQSRRVLEARLTFASHNGFAHLHSRPSPRPTTRSDSLHSNSLYRALLNSNQNLTISSLKRSFSCNDSHDHLDNGFENCEDFDDDQSDRVSVTSTTYSEMSTSFRCFGLPQSTESKLQQFRAHLSSTASRPTSRMDLNTTIEETLLEADDDEDID